MLFIAALFLLLETGEFKIDTTSTYHGLTLKSVTVSYITPGARLAALSSLSLSVCVYSQEAVSKPKPSVVQSEKHTTQSELVFVLAIFCKLFPAFLFFQSLCSKM